MCYVQHNLLCLYCVTPRDTAQVTWSNTLCKYCSRKIVLTLILCRKYSSDEDLPGALASKLGDEKSMEDNFLEDYFSAHSKKSVKTSNNTLSKLACPRMDVNSVKRALAVAPCFEHDTAVLSKEYRSRYDYWLFLMRKGFNILTYGLGSKRSVLEDFRIQLLANVCHFVINGFFPGLTIKEILNVVTSEILHHSTVFRTNFEHARFVVNTLQANNEGARTNFEIYFIIHNIDGLSLRGESAQASLGILAQSPFIHMVASVDHLNASLLWDQKTLSNFNWSWHDTTTYSHYVEEGSYENCLLVQHTNAPGMRSLTRVLPSLTPNAQSLFKLLAKHQLQNDGEGMSFQELYMACRKEFLVNSDLALRTHLIEFTDHKLVKYRKGQDGVESLIIPIDKDVLSQFIEQQTIEE